MAKSYIDIVKYVIEAKFDIDGTVEKPDIIGAIFGQTEGLLGEDLDLRDLQKNGKIGRIEIESSSNSGKTSGTLVLPSSLDRVETCILGAAIESVDRVGPYETNFKVLKIEDTRNEKRAHVINRAKDLLKSLMENVIPDSKEISDMVESEVKSSTVINYGPENLPAGPDIDKSSSIIIVEGRADVVNLLRSDIANAIAVGGATTDIPKSLIKLATEKEVTVFTDGDHGGTMIVKNIASVADIDYVARAPDGKEVEELTRKEIIKALRSKMPMEQAAVVYKISLPESNHNSESRGNNKESANNNYNKDRPRFKNNHNYPQYSKPAEPQEQKKQLRGPEPPVDAEEDKIHVETSREPKVENKEPEAVPAKKEVEENQRPAPERQQSIKKQAAKEELKEKPAELVEKVKLKPEESMIASLSELKNTLRGRIYGSDKKLIAEVPIRELIQSIQDIDNIESIVFDGIITQRLVDLANKKSVKSIYGVRSSQIARKYGSMLLYTSDDV
ncbi:DNA primase [Candidatus Mancarchaeum acidiphilum]|uniref:DNA primase DnaG n=1 Tax=Candidatus Mancarchaeum acidiphilum TaxID=1920749 RepID=A0A218NM37_9ARCH|nr:DNA primase DnaG [Candidatus Mancarchaeum acidiphilum]ASI13529.1 DNA primase [Candidatus Mancarchaeum acidiphilum]